MASIHVSLLVRMIKCGLIARYAVIFEALWKHRCERTTKHDALDNAIVILAAFFEQLR